MWRCGHLFKTSKSRILMKIDSRPPFYIQGNKNITKIFYIPT